MAQMATLNRGPLSLGPLLSGRLKNRSYIDQRISLRLCLSVRGMSVSRALWQNL